jgi:CRISPR-associated protein Cmr1
LKTITPMFGGGAVPREIGDPPIRAASVRGHLRFWWRATSGAQYATARELYDAEAALWGDTDATGAIRTRIDVTAPGRTAPLRGYLPERPSPRFGPEAGFFVFPFNEDKENRIADGRKEVAFLLTVTFPREQEAAIRKAIQAWLAFGGIGARTRRGCGALTVDGADGKEWLPKSPPDAAFFRTLTVPGEADGFSHLSGGWLLFGEPGRDAEACWKRLGAFWSRFRKGHFTNKRPDYQPMSGGQWQDHATLKQARGNDIALAKPYLGLPIIYQRFAGAFSGTLESDVTGRMASPIILKPVAFADGAIRPIVACLSAPAPEVIKINNRIVSLSMPTDDPVLGALRAATPLQAVREAARQSGFNQEVKL